jgi:hypothetical protein
VICVKTLKQLAHLGDFVRTGKSSNDLRTNEFLLGGGSNTRNNKHQIEEAAYTTCDSFELSFVLFFCKVEEDFLANFDTSICFVLKPWMVHGIVWSEALLRVGYKQRIDKILRVLTTPFQRTLIKVTSMAQILSD